VFDFRTNVCYNISDSNRTNYKGGYFMEKKIITISREFGSGGRTIGREVANRLGIPFYDKELVEQIALESGFAWALFDRTEIAPDNKNAAREEGPLYKAYPDKTFGALAAWAWGYSRVVDALEIIGITDPDCIAFTGHSRGGKTALLAGALDPRARIVNPNNSGAGGSGCYRVRMRGTYQDGDEKRSETLRDLLKSFPFWFGPQMQHYTESEEHLPFDQHFLKALVAKTSAFKLF
jgi:hypothetical protein